MSQGARILLHSRMWSWFLIGRNSGVSCGTHRNESSNGNVGSLKSQTWESYTPWKMLDPNTQVSFNYSHYRAKTNTQPMLNLGCVHIKRLRLWLQLLAAATTLKIRTFGHSSRSHCRSHQFEHGLSFQFWYWSIFLLQITFVFSSILKTNTDLAFQLFVK